VFSCDIGVRVPDDVFSHIRGLICLLLRTYDFVTFVVFSYVIRSAYDPILDDGTPPPCILLRHYVIVSGFGRLDPSFCFFVAPLHNVVPFFFLTGPVGEHGSALVALS